jgi:peptidoglycan LD-endopeptidase CwlK
MPKFKINKKTLTLVAIILLALTLSTFYLLRSLNFKKSTDYSAFKQETAPPLTLPSTDKAIKKEALDKLQNSIIIDSNVSLEEALAGVNPQCPKSILDKLTLVTVQYYSFDNKIHQGQVVVDKRLESDIKSIFQYILEIKFPITSVIPISNSRFNWNDDKSMAADNTSSFNYRVVSGSTKLSKHAYGLALDINPKLNPYIRGSKTDPPGAIYNTNKTGTLTNSHPLVKKFKALGWTWGGNWKSVKDYQHFEKK